jgi:hypothetical protein
MYPSIHTSQRAFAGVRTLPISDAAGACSRWPSGAQHHNRLNHHPSLIVAQPSGAMADAQPAVLPPSPRLSAAVAAADAAEASAAAAAAAAAKTAVTTNTPTPADTGAVVTAPVVVVPTPPAPPAPVFLAAAPTPTPVSDAYSHPHPTALPHPSHADWLHLGGPRSSQQRLRLSRRRRWCRYSRRPCSQWPPHPVSWVCPRRWWCLRSPCRP